MGNDIDSSRKKKNDKKPKKKFYMCAVQIAAIQMQFLST